MSQSPDKDSDALYPTVIVIEQYHNEWLKTSVVTDAENLEAARDTSPARGWIPANAIIPLAKEKHTRKQAWFRDTCGDLFTTCDSGTAQIPQ